MAGNVKKIQSGQILKRKTRSDALTEETKALVREFFYQKEVSDTMPGNSLNNFQSKTIGISFSDHYKGSSDYLSVKVPGGGREHRQKRILKKNLDDLHLDFKKANPRVKIGLSSFKYLRYL